MCLDFKKVRAARFIYFVERESQLVPFRFNISFLFFPLVIPGEDKRIKEFYQSRGLERIIQPSGDGE